MTAPLDGFPAVQSEGRCGSPNFREFCKNPNGVVARSELDCCMVRIVKKDEKRAVRCSFSLFCCAEMPRNGSGAQCQKCPVNTFSDVYSSGKLCNPCPAGSKSPEGSTSRSSCMCDVGVLDTASGSLCLASALSTWEKNACLVMFSPQKNV